jgi:hypothetical protein
VAQGAFAFLFLRERTDVGEGYRGAVHRVMSEPDWGALFVELWTTAKETFMKKLIIILVLLSASTALGQAQGPDPRDSLATEPFENTITAGDLARTCQASHNYPAGQCVGMIDGYVTALTNLRPLVMEGRHYDTKLEPHVTRLQVVHVFLLYVNAHPETENQQCYAVLVEALMSAKLLHSLPLDAKGVR